MLGPILYYPTLSALSLRADVLWAEYAYDREPEYRRLRSTERRAWLASDSRAALDWPWLSGHTGGSR